MCAGGLPGCQAGTSRAGRVSADLGRTEEVQGGKMVMLSHNPLGPSQDLRESSKGRCGVGR